MGDLQPLIGNPYNGYINPYYWVEFPIPYGNNGSWSTRSHILIFHIMDLKQAQSNPDEDCCILEILGGSWRFKAGPEAAPLQKLWSSKVLKGCCQCCLSLSSMHSLQKRLWRHNIDWETLNVPQRITLLVPLVIPQQETIGSSTFFSPVRGRSKGHCH